MIVYEDNSVIDEQRIQAYVGLIEQLLICPQGQEWVVLHAKAELMDAGLLEVMEQYAAHLERQDNSSARWLRGFTSQLAQALGISTADLTGAGNAEQFLLETLQLVANSEGDPNRVYPVWSRQQLQLNLELLSALPQVVVQLYEQNAEQRVNIASDLVDFGNLIWQFPLGIRWLNLELGILAYKQALQIYTPTAFPVDWARTQHNLAIAYAERIQGERRDNLETAITAYEQALQVRTRADFPEKWAMTQLNLSNAYSERIYGERSDNLEKAIAAAEQALEVYIRTDFPEEWAGAQNNLAKAYSCRIRGERADNVEKAITAYELALQVRTRETFHQDWAMTQNNLATAYHHRIYGERADNLEKAIAAAEQALQVYTRTDFPERWAGTQINLAVVYFERIQGEHADNLEVAIETYQQALQVYTPTDFPMDWAMTQNNLANAYQCRIRGERADNLEVAIASCLRALQVYTFTAYPERWAMTQNNLAAIYLYRIQGDRSDNLEAALSASELALQVRTRTAYPEEWAMTLNNLAMIYSERICGEHSDNLETAIDVGLQALQVYTSTAFPEKWAMIQRNLAVLYSKRIRGERANNLEASIAACEQALQIYTRTAFPEKWAMMQSNLATFYIDYSRVVVASHIEATVVQTNLDKAVAACEQALQVYTPTAFPKDCRITARNLGDVYFEEQAWLDASRAYTTALDAAETLYQSCILLEGKASELTETAYLHRRAAYALARINKFSNAVETLEQGRARGLSESLDRDRTNFTQLQQQNPDLYDQYKDLANQLRNIEAIQRDRMTSAERHSITPETLRNKATCIRQQLTEIIDQIRQQPGYKTFLTLHTFADVQKTVTSEHSLVYLLTTLAGSLALIITPTSIDHIWLDDFTDTHLTDLLATWFTAYENARKDRQTWLNTIDQTTQRLWNFLIGSLVQKLKDLGCDHTILIPTGYLGLLPLHAAWTEDSNTPTGRRYALDEIHFTYTPNAKSLTAARAIADRTAINAILAIDNPRNNLPNASREVAAVIASFQQPVILLQEKATVAAVKATLPNTNIAHFACHGTAKLNDPLTSGLLMSDDLLSLRDIFALNLADHGGLRLAILSACETGISGIENIDEAISLPTGLLQAGVAGVVASLWSVDDRSTMLLLSKFYELWRTANKEPSEALRQAQIWLRDSTTGEIANYGGLFDPTPDDRRYAHPFYWAAFSYTGI